MEYAKFCLVFCAFVVLCGVGKAIEEQEQQLVPAAPVVADLVDADANSQTDVDVEGTRKVRQYFGPPPPPFFGPPPPPYYGGGFGGFGGGYGGFGFGGGYQRTRVVTRTRYRGGFGGFGGGYYG